MGDESALSHTGGVCVRQCCAVCSMCVSVSVCVRCTLGFLCAFLRAHCRRFAAQLVRTLEGHTETVYALAASPDGRFIYSGCFDKTVKQWRADSGEVRARAGPLASDCVTACGCVRACAMGDESAQSRCGRCVRASVFA